MYGMYLWDIIFRILLLFGIVISEKNKFKENRASQKDSIVASEKLSNEVTSDADAMDVDIKKDVKSEPSDELKEWHIIL